MKGGKKEMIHKNMKSCNLWSMISFKLAIAFAVLFIITVWQGAMNLINSIHWGWFLAATIIFIALTHVKGCCRKK